MANPIRMWTLGFGDTVPMIQIVSKKEVFRCSKFDCRGLLINKLDSKTKENIISDKIKGIDIPNKERLLILICTKCNAEYSIPLEEIKEI